MQSRSNWNSDVFSSCSTRSKASKAQTKKSEENCSDIPQDFRILSNIRSFSLLLWKNLLVHQIIGNMDGLEIQVVQFYLVSFPPKLEDQKYEAG